MKTWTILQLTFQSFYQNEEIRVRMMKADGWK